MTLEEIYGVDSPEWHMNMNDLHQAANIIDCWLDGGEVNPYLAHYIGMMCLSISERAPELPEEEDGSVKEKES
ncbi:TPA: hypothetical protein MNC13_005291 [Citrobacter freundii]|nr:hypothetical protein [Citrobacter freundii]